MLIGSMTVAGNSGTPPAQWPPQRSLGELLPGWRARCAIRCEVGPRRRAGSRPCPQAMPRSCSARRSIWSPRSREDGASIGPAQVERRCCVDARLEPIISQLTAQYTANYQRSSSVETPPLARRLRLGERRSPQRIEATLKAGYAAGEQKRWNTVLPRVLVQASRTSRRSTASSACSATATGLPAQWRELQRPSTNLRACAAGSAKPLAFGGGSFIQPGVSLEQEYIRDVCC